MENQINSLVAQLANLIHKRPTTCLLLCINLFCHAADTSKTLSLDFLPDDLNPFLVMNQHASAPVVQLICKVFPLTDSILIIHRTHTDGAILHETAPAFKKRVKSVIRKKICADALMIERIIEQLNEPGNYTFLVYKLLLLGPEYVATQITMPLTQASKVEFKYESNHRFVRCLDEKLEIGPPPEATHSRSIDIISLVQETLSADPSKSLFIFDHINAKKYLTEKNEAILSTLNEQAKIGSQKRRGFDPN